MKITRKKFSSLRRNQMVTNFGVGAIVDFPDQSLMGCNIEEWGNKGEKIHDTRLEKILKVDHFRLPPSNNPIPYVRFPKWHFCISCRELKKLGEWRKSYVKKYNKDWEVPTCPSCNLTLIPSRFIVICEQGHIDDFP
ncbi:hypothetical protein TEPIDINF_000221 [Tepidibacillus infernus]|uniref:hypothetical protein n=1 Tax=Tepidibacillus infernus TaxID=1806172 RepID=UPI003B7110CF